MTLLITGGTGFVMGNLARAWLESDPAARAVVLDSAPPDALAAAFFAPLGERLTTVVGDVGDRALLDRLAREHPIRQIVHGAAVTSVNRLTTAGDGRPDIAGARPAIETNVLGTLELLGLACRLPDLTRFVTVSSGSVYGDEGPSPLPEEGTVAPDGLYDISKYAAELLTANAARQFGVPAVSVRFSGVYGPLDRETGARAVRCVPLRIAERALAGETVRVNALEAAGDFVHAGDLAEGLCRLLRGRAPRHGVYNIAQGETVAVEALLDYAAEVVPGLARAVVPAAEADVVLDPARASGRWGAYDISRMAEDFGWRPRPVRTAFQDYIAWLSSTRYCV